MGEYRSYSGWTETLLKPGKCFGSERLGHPNLDVLLLSAGRKSVAVVPLQGHDELPV